MTVRYDCPDALVCRKLLSPLPSSKVTPAMQEIVRALEAKRDAARQGEEGGAALVRSATADAVA